MCAVSQRTAIVGLVPSAAKAFRAQRFALSSSSTSYFCSSPVSSHSIDFPNSRLIFQEDIRESWHGTNGNGATSPLGFNGVNRITELHEKRYGI